MEFTEEISKYDVAYYGGGRTANGYQYRAIIGLRRSDNSLIGAAYFHRNPETMPETDSRETSGYVYVHYAAEDFPQVMDLLRNERPVYIHYVGGSWDLGSITTSMEPIGEGEAP